MAALDPSPRSHHLVAIFYWEKAFKDLSSAPAEQLEYIEAGIAATDKALWHRPDYVDALVYKNILLRMAANLDTANSDSLIAQADVLRNRAMELQRARDGVSGGVAAGARRIRRRRSSRDGVRPARARARRLRPHRPTEVSPRLPRSAPVPEFVDGLGPVRVGGSIKPPVKVRDVKPFYPPMRRARACRAW